MAKTVCLFGWVKSFFTSEPKTNSEKKPKKWRRFIEIFRIKQYPAIKLPETTLNEATEERRRQALTVAMATAAAAEAAVAAANAAAEVVRLTDISGRYYRFSKSDRILAAIKIQSAFRGHLARKALRALKGLVRLQAIVRGRAVRRQTDASLRQLMFDARRNSKISQKRTLIAEQSCSNCEKKQSLQPKTEFEEDESKLDCSSLRNWDYSILSKKGMEALQLRRQEAITKRERMMRYSFSHREGRNVQIAEEWSPGKIGSRLLNPSDGGETSNTERKETLRSTVRINLINDENYGQKQVKLGNQGKREEFLEGLNSSQYPFPRRSFCHVKHNSSSDGETYMPSSPVFPTYMAITESARAKTRSMSTPRQRVGFRDSFSRLQFPYENDISFWTSYDGELAGVVHEIS